MSITSVVVEGGNFPEVLGQIFALRIVSRVLEKSLHSALHRVMTSEAQHLTVFEILENNLSFSLLS